MKPTSKEKKTIPKISAGSFGAKLENGITRIPKNIGTGYIKGFIINPRLRLIVRQYELKEEWMLDRGISEDGNEFVVFSFQNVYHAKETIRNHKLQAPSGGMLLPSVQIATTDFNYELLPANRKVNSIVVTVHVDYLRALLQPKTENTFLQVILAGTQPFLFEEILSPGIQDIAAAIVMADPPKELQEYYYKIKAEELIYLLLVELLKRQDTSMQKLNAADIRKILEVKTSILSNIETPPVIADLVKLSGMSESKLKRLFKQIFGNSIFNYYQAFRMKEAAYLIKEEKISVSEAGYRLGFSNLSHFTRLFETHIGVKPKKYSLTV
ncbi:AraC-type DNA-binding protein [Chitinophaga sp. YR627]|nr:AraC-type DNA-binding protein [Chitinophaga sp. YR627]